MLSLTNISAVALDTLTGKAILVIDEKLPDGLAKEIVCRLAALAVVDGHDDAKSLTNIAATFAGFITNGAQPLATILTGYLNDKHLILLPEDADAADAVISVHSIIKSVVEGQTFDVEKIPPVEPAIKAAPKGKKAAPGTIKPSKPVDAGDASDSATAGVPDMQTVLNTIGSIDLDTFLDDAHEPMRPYITRMVGHFYPDAFKVYRSIKDNGTATAKRDAYSFMLTAFRKFIGAGAAV